MNKQSNASLLKQASAMLQHVVTERDKLAVKVAQLAKKVGEYEQQERIIKVAQKLDNRGPYAGMPLEDRVNFVQAKLAEGMDLNELDRVVSLIAPDGSIGVLGNEKTAARLSGEDRFREEIMS